MNNVFALDLSSSFDITLRPNDDEYVTRDRVTNTSVHRQNDLSSVRRVSERDRESTWRLHQWWKRLPFRKNYEIIVEKMMVIGETIWYMEINCCHDRPTFYLSWDEMKDVGNMNKEMFYFNRMIAWLIDWWATYLINWLMFPNIDLNWTLQNDMHSPLVLIEIKTKIVGCWWIAKW